MIEPLILISILIGFFVTFVFTPIWIRRVRIAGLVGKDMHKKGSEVVAEAGGISVILGFILGVLFYVAFKTFYLKSSENVLEIFAMLSSILIISLIGFTDDILGWKIGLNKKSRIVFLFFSAIPLMVINAGVSSVMGIEFGIAYPLLLIPLGIIGASATFNMLEGYNGLGASQGIIILSALAFVNWFSGNAWLSVIALTMAAALLGFYFFNSFPARVFPGDILTYGVGALIAVIAILGNIEKIALFFFIPYIIETILKLRGKLSKESFAKVNEDGSLDQPYKKIYGLEHFSIWILKKMDWRKVREKDVVMILNLFQILIIVLGILIFKSHIF